jgi:hypothetical protein
MQFEHEVKLVIKVESSNLEEILLAFLKTLGPLFGDLVRMIMVHYALEYGKTGRLSTILGLCEGDKWHWKSKQGYQSITIHTLFGKVKLPNPVVEIVRQDGRREKRVLGRKLLEVSAYGQIPDFMKKILGSLGGLMSFGNVEKSMRGFGIFRVCLSSIWRSVDWLCKRMVVEVKEKGGQDEIIELDGTGVNTLNSGKRGSEVKIVMQRNKAGGLSFLGVKVGKYGLKSDWEALLSPLKPLLEKGKRCILVADGDDTPMNIFKSLSDKSYTFCQRCLWHIPRQFRYMLWKDKATPAQRTIYLSLCYAAFRLRKNVAPEDLADYIQLKIARIENLIDQCLKLGLTTCATFIGNAKDNAFVLGRNTNDNHNTSLTERAMRTIKQRTKYATWSEKGSENVIKIRLDLFYNHTFKGLHFET